MADQDKNSHGTKRTVGPYLNRAIGTGSRESSYEVRDNGYSDSFKDDNRMHRPGNVKGKRENPSFK